MVGLMSDELWLAVIQGAAAVLVSAMAVLVPLLVNSVRKNTNLQITAAQEAQFEHVAREAVLIVKEMAAAKVKANRGAMTPAEKLSTAISTVQEALPDKTRQDIERKVIAAMPQVGEGAAVNPPQAPGA